MTIRKELSRGVFWIAVAKYTGILISLVVSAILARNISPSAFGTLAVATVVMAFLDMLADMGLGSAVVQFKDLTGKDIRSLYSISILIAVILTIVLYLSANAVAGYYSDSSLSVVIRILCICVFFNSLNVIPNGMMLRNKKFKSIAVRTLCIQIICGTCACLAAVKGWGIYALIITPVFTSVGVFCFNFYNYPQKLALPIDYVVVKRVWGYSFFQFLYSFINFFSRNADKLIIGKFFSMNDLGYYEKSYRLMQLPLQNITFVITPVLHPILSSLQDNKESLGLKNTHLTRVLSQISFPLGIFLFFCASPIILIIFGSDWIPSIPVFKILTLSLPLQVILSSSGSFFLASGHTDHMFYCGCQSAICTVGAFIFTAFFFKSIEAMAWAWNISLVVNFIFCYWFMYRFTFKMSIWLFFRELLPQVLNSSVTIIVVLAALWVWTPKELFLEAVWIFCITSIPTLVMGFLLDQYSIHDLWIKIIRIAKAKNSDNNDRNSEI